MFQSPEIVTHRTHISSFGGPGTKSNVFHRPATEMQATTVALTGYCLPCRFCPWWNYVEILFAANAVFSRLAWDVKLWFVEIRKTNFAGSPNFRQQVFAIQIVAHANILRSLIKFGDCFFVQHVIFERTIC